MAGGTRVVLPAPGSATSTSDRFARSVAVICGRNGSIGSGTRGVIGRLYAARPPIICTKPSGRRYPSAARQQGGAAEADHRQ